MSDYKSKTIFAFVYYNNLASHDIPQEAIGRLSQQRGTQ